MTLVESPPAGLDQRSGMTEKPWEPPTAQTIKDRWRAIQDDMLDTRRSFMLNSSFYHGDQWLRWDDNMSVANILQFKDTDDSLTRQTVNMIKPRLNTLLARLCRTPLAFEPRPEGTDSWSIERATLCRQILDVKAHRDSWAQVRRQALFLALLGGVSAIAIEPAYKWDDESIPDGSGGMIKVPSRPSPKLTALAAPEFGLEPGSRDETDALYWMRCTTLTPLQCKREYDLDHLPTTDTAAMMGAMQRVLRLNRRGSTNTQACSVFVYYERPTDQSPGCIMHVVGEKVVRQSGWTLPYRDYLNVVTFTETEIAGTWKGDTLVNDARQLQVAVNKAFTSINSNILRTDNNRMLLPDGAVLDGEDEMTGQPGEIIRYNHENGKPEWMQTPEIAARGMREHIGALESQLDDLFYTHAISRGEQVGDRNSGLALSILAEKDDTPLGVLAEDQQRGWQRVAEQVLMQEKYLLSIVDQATQNIPGAQPMQVSDVLMSNPQPGQPGVQPENVTWTANDLPDTPTVHVPLDATMPRSRAAEQEAMLKFAVQMPTMFQGLGPSQLARVLQVSDLTTFQEVLDPHVAEACWENARMASGEDEQVVQVAPWQPHPVHIKEHNDFRATASYRDANPQIRQFVDLHVQAHMTLFAQDQQLQQQEQAQQAQVMATAGQPPQLQQGTGNHQ